MKIAESELIINPDGSIYHLNLLPEDIAETIIFVGDPDRVSHVSKHFDTIEVQKSKREFVTHTGTLKGKRLTVISTGIGTDNIDIVLNELDALVNIDLKSRKVKDQLTSLEIIRIGTSGSLHSDIKVDEFLISELAVGFDNLPHFYKDQFTENKEIEVYFKKHTDWYSEKSSPYIVNADPGLVERLRSDETHMGFTATSIGFYGPQSRILRLEPQDRELNDKLASFNYEGRRITNLEMETAGIYVMSKLLGHKAISMNCILANRPDGEFSKTPASSVNRLIRYTLEKITA
ncbi:phosphorylase [Leptobacterium flavescens]|uniref:Uridine phosphorylase n=1 Tax=Leptobacterium flavescens TaxID=472055 RepID=A0A6P0UJF2_9FLAO|nr:nucleoside phosphorylase [Leptobacterium flavescens]NER13425.1 phosphorylase [Leptobacterium flavescens]